MTSENGKSMNHFLSSTCEWLRGSGPESDIVLSSRIRLASKVFPTPVGPIKIKFPMGRRGLRSPERDLRTACAMALIASS